MIVNPGKLEAIILDKPKHNHTQEIIKADNKAVKVKPSVKPLGVQIETAKHCQYLQICSRST